ncbi:hypothetical protein DXV75_10545 [Alteromonas aestuariivivens]|uniref:Sulfotransferase domain-containing protein n=1 Tax=Alteromonas aestuariivivens TaxID=1938339 RepID=A0A3D8M654_9ALTE|nr:sulfotransferase domain-containing protein [Alteromonas aestuariivivens]RDV25060.1 hypothetical protein DXV75_10545 [Alteromonas aestuariivivens]
MSFSKQMLSPIWASDEVHDSECAPSFIGLGTPKTGTSWWFELLLQHPLIESNQFNVKETCYFCHAWSENQNDQFLNGYRKGFKKAEANIISGEWSTLYFSHPYALERVVEAFPDIKFFLTFRSPLPMFYSWLNQLMRNRARSMLKESEEARFMYLNYDAVPSLFSQISIFPQRLHWLKKKVGDNLLCLQYEKNVIDTQGQIDRCMVHLGLPSFEVKSAEVRVNKADENLVQDLKIPAVTKDALKETGEELLKLCPDFDEALWK